MPTIPPLSPSRSRFSRHGFHQLDGNAQSTNMGNPNEQSGIPLQTVVSHTPLQTRGTDSSVSEKGGVFHHGGRRKLKSADGEVNQKAVESDDEEMFSLNRMGRLYSKILHFSVVTRYIIYVSPLALALAIPIIIGSTVDRDTQIGGVSMARFFVWIEFLWLSLWASKIAAHFLPMIFKTLIGVVSAGIQKYALILSALEIPISLVIWAAVNKIVFKILVPSGESWTHTMGNLLMAAVISACVLLAERLLIQLISISYHRKQFDTKIKDSKRNIHLLGLLYDASRALFPAYCSEFAEEDYIIQDCLQLNLPGQKGQGQTMPQAPMRLLQDASRLGDKVTSVFGSVAQEITGKKVFDVNSAHSIVIEALERNRSAEALARRIWLSFVVEGKDNLYQEDLLEVMGSGRHKEAEECFAALDRDGNGDISLDEMILTVTEYGRERKAIATSMHDVDQAINALDALLSTIIFVICIFIFIAFLSPSFVGTLTTSATALLSLSFVFASTCQEVLGSCIFLFVKHPYDIGDRVDLSDGEDRLTVEHISLLYTVFKRVQNGKLVQIPNIELNSLWVDNISRSKAMREQISVPISFDTSFEDVNILKQELSNFLRDPQNSRDFHPELEVEVQSLEDMDKLVLQVDIRHKSNWSNESLRASRRSKFMCALVLALRKIPIYGPGGGDASLGSPSKPSWSVAVSPEVAKAAMAKFSEDKDAKRLYPTKKPAPNTEHQNSGTNYLGVQVETQAIGAINNRSPRVDPARDDTWAQRDDVSTLGRPSLDDRPNAEELHGLLRKETSRGKRRQNGSVSSRRGVTSVTSVASNTLQQTPAAGAVFSTNPPPQYSYPAPSSPPPRAGVPQSQRPQAPRLVAQTTGVSSNPYRTQSPGPGA